MIFHFQNKRGKYDRNEDLEEKEKVSEEPVEDPLKDATTLYVGNLYGFCSNHFVLRKINVKLTPISDLSTLLKNRYMNYSQNVARSSGLLWA